MYDGLLGLIEKSEARMEKTNDMVQTLAHTCARNTEVYDKHITSLEQSRDAAQKHASESIEESKNLTTMLEKMRGDYQAQLAALKAELHSMKDEYRGNLAEMRNDYKELSASYRRLVEGRSSMRTEVSVNSRNKSVK